MSHHLLIVDDEDDILDVLEELFTGRGYRITRASNAEQATEILEDLTPDLIVSDYQMPGMDGVEFLQKVQVSLPDPPRILLTAHGDLKVAIAAINEANIYKFITKPWNNSDLLLTVQRALEHYELIRQNRAFAETLELMVEENTEEIDRLRSALIEMANRIRSLIP